MIRTINARAQGGKPPEGGAASKKVWEITASSSEKPPQGGVGVVYSRETINQDIEDRDDNPSGFPSILLISVA
jgi:hypothetical protein